MKKNIKQIEFEYKLFLIELISLPIELLIDCPYITFEEYCFNYKGFKTKDYIIKRKFGIVIKEV